MAQNGYLYYPIENKIVPVGKSGKVNKPARKIAKVIWTAVGCVLVCFIFATLITFRATGTQMVSILSGSMSPSIKTGSLIITKKPPAAQNIKVGDVITYKVTLTQGHNVRVTHRVTYITQNPETGGTMFRTKGDNLAQEDGYYVPYESIVGIHNGITIPLAGYIVGFYSSLYGIITLMAYILLFIVFTLLIKKMYPDQQPQKLSPASTTL